MTKFKIKSGDTVQVISGDHKGTEGKVLKVLKDKNKAIVEGVNMVKKHTKPRWHCRERSSYPYVKFIFINR